MSADLPLPLYLVCDGSRDHAAVCRLLERVLGRPITPDCQTWLRLHSRGSGRGYGRKLKYSVRQAISRGQARVVATMDQDNSERREKLRELQAAREEDRRTGKILPTALGEAAPHFEAWLLDDAVAVREGLGLRGDAAVPSLKRIKQPKAELDAIFRREVTDWHGREAELMAAIADKLEVSRCLHAKQTGLEAFVDDVVNELRQLQ